MEGNKDEAIKCLSIAQRYRDAGNLPSARKFAQKSINLFSTPEAVKLLESIAATEQSSSAGAGPSAANGSAQASSSSTEAHPSASGAKLRSTGSANGTAGGMGGEKREFTAEQLKVVKRVKACKVTEYYEILSLKKDCEEAEVKKAYRKLALVLHPDKNGAPGADEAFKMVSKAFQVLSGMIDLFFVPYTALTFAQIPRSEQFMTSLGSDPESRSSGMSSRGPGFSATPFGGGFEGEMSPEDLFNMFFGGGGMAMNNGFGGSPFGGPVFAASFGPGGFRTTRTRTNMGGAQQQAEGAQGRSLLMQLLPLLLLIGFSFLSAIPDLFSTSVPEPRYSFSPSSRFNLERHTDGLGIKYHVNGPEFNNHPHIAADLAKGQRRSGSALSQFEGQVERSYTNNLYSDCQHGVERRQRRRDTEVGVFGIGTDWEKVKAIEGEKIESCEELKRLGVIRS